MSNKRDAVMESIYSPFLRNKTRSNNEAIKNIYIRVISTMCMSRFKWKNLPDSVDERFLELALLQQGLCVFYFDTEYDRYMALRAGASGTINMYDNPTSFTIMGNQMVHKTLKGNECVPIWANVYRFPEWDIIVKYAERLANVENTIDQNIRAMKTPFIISSNANNKLTIQNAYKQISEGEPVIIGTESFGPEEIMNKIQVFTTNLPHGVLSEIHSARSRIMNECLTLLGIMNTNTEKKERMIVEEATGSAGHVLAMRAAYMRQREIACGQINKMYGLNVQCEWVLDDGASSHFLDGLIGSDING